MIIDINLHENQREFPKLQFIVIHIMQWKLQLVNNAQKQIPKNVQRK